MYRAITIGRNEKCPCNSGKKYKQCCMNSKDIFAINYKNKPVSIDKAENMLLYNKILAFNDRLLPNMELGVNQGVELLTMAYELFDQAVEPISEVCSCTKGCSACCRLILDIHGIEAENIRRYVINNIDENKINRIVNDFKKLLPYTPTMEQRVNNNELRYKYFEKYLSCAFLDDKGECSIYPVRPIKCRSYFVFSDPEICKPNKKHHPVQYGGEIIEITLNSVQKVDAIIYGKGKGSYIKSLAYWFFNGFEKEIERYW